jgi:hypothetical protein
VVLDLLTRVAVAQAVGAGAQHLPAVTGHVNSGLIVAE